MDELSAEDQCATSQPLEVEQFFDGFSVCDRRYLNIEALLQGPSLADFRHGLMVHLYS